MLCQQNSQRYSDVCLQNRLVHSYRNIIVVKVSFEWVDRLCAGNLYGEISSGGKEEEDER